jgi:hypothetical protein
MGFCDSKVLFADRKKDSRPLNGLSKLFFSQKLIGPLRIGARQGRAWFLGIIEITGVSTVDVRGFDQGL